MRPPGTHASIRPCPISAWGALVALFLFALVLLPARAAAAGTIGIEEAIEKALRNAERMKIARAGAEAVRESGREAVAFARPQLVLEGGYYRVGTTAEEIPIPGFENPDDNASVSLTASQVLLAGGRITGSRALDRALGGQAALAERTAEAAVRQAVREAFQRVLLARALVGIDRERLAQREGELKDARSLHRAGMVTPLDVRQAEMSMDMGRDALIASETDLTRARIEFNLAIGEEVEGELIDPAGVLARAPEVHELMEHLAARLDGGTLVASEAARAAHDAARARERIEAGARWPVLSLVGQAETAGDTTDGMDESWAVGLQASWTLIDGGTVRARTAQAHAAARAAEDEAALTAKSLAGQLRTMRELAGALDRRIALQEGSVSRAGENYEDGRRQYRAGTITLTDLGEFGLTLEETRTRLLQLYFEEQSLAAEARALLE
jgi:outer membrane protein TolC